MHHPTDRITHTTAFVTPVVEHWLEREIAHIKLGRRPLRPKAWWSFTNIMASMPCLNLNVLLLLLLFFLLLLLLFVYLFIYLILKGIPQDQHISSKTKNI